MGLNKGNLRFLGLGVHPYPLTPQGYGSLLDALMIKTLLQGIWKNVLIYNLLQCNNLCNSTIDGSNISESRFLLFDKSEASSRLDFLRGSIVDIPFTS